MDNIFVAFVLVIAIMSRSTLAAHKCVWVRGFVKCLKDPSKQLNIEIRLYDRDGISLAQIIDPDDLMGVTFTDEDGMFQLDGCGDDFDWIPGIPNNPEPYVKIMHYCNSDKGDVLILPEFKVFVPETYDLGVVELDTSTSSNPPNATMDLS